MSEVAVQLRYARIAPRKARAVIDLIRGKRVEWAKAQLTTSGKKAAYYAVKLLTSGIAAAKEKKMNVDALSIKEAIVGEGPRLKRVIAHFRGVARPIDKQMSHLTLVLTDELLKTEGRKTKKRSSVVPSGMKG